MAKEIDLLKKLAKGIENKSNSSNKLNTEQEDDKNNSDNKYQVIPLRSVEEIIKGDKTIGDMEKHDR